MKKALILMFVYGLIISGCTAFRYGVKKYDLKEVTSADISGRLKQNYTDLRSLSGNFDFSYSTEKERNQSSGYIYITATDTIYIEIKGLVGETEAVIFLDKDSVRAVNYMEKVIIKGKNDENSIRRITGMNYDVSDLRNSLLCYTGRSDSVNFVRKETDRLIIRIILNEKEYQFVTLNENLLITEIEEYYERELKFKKQYDYFTNENGHVLPRRIRINTFNPPTKLTVYYTSINTDEYKEIDFEAEL